MRPCSPGSCSSGCHGRHPRHRHRGGRRFIDAPRALFGRTRAAWRARSARRRRSSARPAGRAPRGDRPGRRARLPRRRDRRLARPAAWVRRVEITEPHWALPARAQRRRAASLVEQRLGEPQASTDASVLYLYSDGYPEHRRVLFRRGRVRRIEWLYAAGRLGGYPERRCPPHELAARPDPGDLRGLLRRPRARPAAGPPCRPHRRGHHRRRRHGGGRPAALGRRRAQRGRPHARPAVRHDDRRRLPAAVGVLQPGDAVGDPPRAAARAACSAAVIAAAGVLSALFVNDVDLPGARARWSSAVTRRLQLPPGALSDRAGHRGQRGQRRHPDRQPAEHAGGQLLQHRAIADSWSAQAPVALLGLVCVFAVVWLVYRRSCRREFPVAGEPERHVVHYPLMVKTLIAVGVMLVAFLAGVPIAVVAIGGRGLLAADAAGEARRRSTARSTGRCWCSSSACSCSPAGWRPPGSPTSWRSWAGRIGLAPPRRSSRSVAARRLQPRLQRARRAALQAADPDAGRARPRLAASWPWPRRWPATSR